MHDMNKMQNERQKPNHEGNNISHLRKRQELELRIWKVVSVVLQSRWLLLSLWFSIPCYPRCSWRSIRCNTFLRCVCRDPMNCGFMINLSMNIIWISSEFLYAWFDIFASLFELSIWFGQLDWFFLQREKCLALGSILRCPFQVTVGVARHILYCCHQG